MNETPHFFKSFYSNYQDELRRYVSVRLGDTADADEIVHDAFYNFMQVEAPDELENPRAYLYRSAHNLALNRIRKNKHHGKYIAEQDHEKSTPSLERTVIARIDIEHIQTALELLPATSKEVFYLTV